MGGRKGAGIRSFLLLLSLTLLLTLPAPVTLAQTATARFTSQQQIAWPIPFSDAFLSGDGKIYHQQLARASLGMALSAFRVPEAEPARRGDNITAYLTELGFSGISLSQYDLTPTINTIATAIAHRQVTGTAPFTAVAVAVSGGGYQDEWQSNFTLGTGLHHKGFDQAARQVVSRLADYIKKQKIDGLVKIWITGYSRAAAVSNRAAALLLDAKRVQPENLFAYTFATPNVTKQDDAQAYPAIFNIVGAFDPVMMVPFDDWGFTRFGQTYYLPSLETNSDYEKRVMPVKAKYLQMTGTEYLTTASGNRLLHKVLSLFSTNITDTENYARHFQRYFTSLWTQRNSALGMLFQSVQLFLEDGELFRQMRGITDQAWTIYANNAGENLLKDRGFYADDRLVDAGPYGELVHEHYPKKYLAWLAAFDDLAQMASPSRDYRQLAVSGAVNLRIQDDQGRTVLLYRADQPPRPGEKPALPLSQAGDDILVTVPADRAYQAALWSKGPEAAQAALAIREGRVGFTGMRVYKSPALTIQAGQLYLCALPPGTTQTAAYALTTSGATIPLNPAPDASLFSPGEKDSSIKTLLSKNLVTLLGALVLLFVQALFFLIAGTRAGIRHRRDRAMRLKACAPHANDPLGHRLLARLPASRGLRAAGFLLFFLASVMMAAALVLAIAWGREAAATPQVSLRRFSALTSLPYLVLMMLSSLPALAAALEVLFRLEKRQGGTRGCRFFCLFALVYSMGLVAFSVYNSFSSITLAHPWLSGLALALTAALGLTIAFLIRYQHLKRGASV